MYVSVDQASSRALQSKPSKIHSWCTLGKRSTNRTEQISHDKHLFFFCILMATTCAGLPSQLSTWLQRLMDQGPQIAPTRDKVEGLRSELVPVELPGAAGVAWWPRRVAICGYGANLERRMEGFNHFVVHDLQQELRVNARKESNWASGLTPEVMSNVLGHPSCFKTFLRVLSCPMVIVRSLGCLGESEALG